MRQVDIMTGRQGDTWSVEQSMGTTPRGGYRRHRVSGTTAASILSLPHCAIAAAVKVFHRGGIIGT